MTMRCRCCGLEIPTDEVLFEDLCTDCVTADMDDPLPEYDDQPPA